MGGGGGLKSKMHQHQQQDASELARMLSNMVHHYYEDEHNIQLALAASLQASSAQHGGGGGGGSARLQSWAGAAGVHQAPCGSRGMPSKEHKGGTHAASRTHKVARHMPPAVTYDLTADSSDDTASEVICLDDA